MRTVQFQWGCALALAVALCGGTWPSYGKDAMNHKNQQVVRRTQGDGRWFPGDKATLSKMINEYVGAAQVSPIKGRIIGAISPHAGYIYSGAIAGYVFRVIKEQAAKGEAPDTVVILAWNFADEIKEELASRFGFGGSYITPLPDEPRHT